MHAIALRRAATWLVAATVSLVAAALPGPAHASPRPATRAPHLTGAIAEQPGRSAAPRALRFTLDRAATVRIALQRRAARRWRGVATLTARGIAGRNRVALPASVRRKVTAAGRYRAVLVATSGRRRSAAVDVRFAIAAPAPAATIAATPPMGWNSWNTFGCAVTEQDIRAAANALVATGMKAAGYRYVIVDDCWFDPHRAPDGSLRADPAKFPHGIKALADDIHRLGLGFGIYEAPRERTCAQNGSAAATGSLGHERQDAATFASWGVDYLKYDWCSADGTLADQIAAFTTMRDALRATGRPIVYSINPNSLHETTGPAYDWSRIANLWRTTQDVIPVWDREPWNTALLGVEHFDGIINAVDETAPLDARTGPGHFNDPDMLVVGTQAVPYLAALFARVPAADTQALAGAEASPTAEEMRSQLSMWAMLAAPLIAGNDPSTMGADVQAMLTNRELIAVDQDPRATAGRPVRRYSDQEVWARPLADGSVAIALLDRAQVPATMSVSAQAAGLPAAPRYDVRDVWAHTSSTSTGNLSAQVPGHGVVLLRVRPAG